MIRKAIEADASACLAVYRSYIVDSIVSFEWIVPSDEEFLGRFKSISKAYPWLVYEDRGIIQGFAYASSFRSRIAYQWSVETSVYLAKESQGRGLGRELYRELFAALKAQGYVNAYAAISLPNDSSVGFHEAQGFRKIAHFEKTGFKNGKWIDVGFWSKSIAEPAPQPAAPKTQP